MRVTICDLYSQHVEGVQPHTTCCVLIPTVVFSILPFYAIFQSEIMSLYFHQR